MNCAGGLLGQQVRVWMAMKYSGEINPDCTIRDGLGVARRRRRGDLEARSRISCPERGAYGGLA